MPHVWQLAQKMHAMGIVIECYGEDCQGPMLPNVRLDAWRWGVKGMAR